MGESLRFTVELGGRGRIVLPAPIRHCLALEEGDEVILTLENDVVRLETRKHLADQFLGKYKKLSAKKSLVDELISDRSREGENE